MIDNKKIIFECKCGRHIKLSELMSDFHDLPLKALYQIKYICDKLVDKNSQKYHIEEEKINEEDFLTIDV